MMHPGVVLSETGGAPVVYLASMKTDPKVREMSIRPEVALLMHESPDGSEYSSWEIEMTGRARLVTDPTERARGLEATARTSAIVRSLAEANALGVLAVLRVDPTFIKHRRFAEIVQGKAPDLWDLRAQVALPTDGALLTQWWGLAQDIVRWPTLSASLASVAVGAAAALSSVGLTGTPVAFDQLTAVRIAAAAVGAVSLQAALNVRNDLDDDRSGADAANPTPMVGFTGGSRVLQRGLADRRTLVGWMMSLLIVATLCGGLLVALDRPAVVLWGMGGLLLGWLYTGRPVALARWGLGEVAVALAFGLGIVTGAAYSVAGVVSSLALASAFPVALTIGLVLYINSFQDAVGDTLVGKMTLVSRLTPRRARLGYPVFLLGLGLLFGGLILTQVLPLQAALVALTVPIWLVASRVVLRFWDAPQDLVPANALTAIGHVAGAALLSLALLWDRFADTTSWLPVVVLAVALAVIARYARHVWNLARAAKVAIQSLGGGSPSPTPAV